MKQQINTACRACYFHIRQIISKIRKILSQESVAKLVSCFVLSRLDYCNSLLADLPTESINKLPNVQNCADRLVLGIWKREHITPALENLHWLPISQRIHYKLSLFSATRASSLFFLHISLTFSVRTLSLALCALQVIQPDSLSHDTGSSITASVPFPDLHLLSGTHCLLFSVKLTPQTLSKNTSKLTFSAPSRPYAQPERIELSRLPKQV